MIWSSRRNVTVSWGPLHDTVLVMSASVHCFDRSDLIVTQTFDRSSHVAVDGIIGNGPLQFRASGMLTPDDASKVPAGLGFNCRNTIGKGWFKALGT